VKSLHRDLGPHDRAALVVFADLHKGGTGGMSRRAYEYREWILAAPNRFVATNGDLFNLATPGSPEISSEQKLTNTAQFKEVRDFLSPFVEYDRLLSVNDGNHERRVKKAADLNIGFILCESLGVAHLYTGSADDWGYGAFLDLRVGLNRHGRRVMYRVYLNHGVGGGRTAGAGLNRVDKFTGMVHADCYVMSHCHSAAVTPRGHFEYDPRKRSLEVVPHWLVTTGPFLEYEGYQEGMALQPVPCETPIIWLDGTEKRIEPTFEFPRSKAA